jgi:YVTN family beta-propeller protein
MRKPLLLLSLGLAGCATMLGGPGPGKVYVANMESHTISVIDGASLKPVATIEARGQNPHDLFLAPGGHRLFATNMGSGTVTVVDTSTDQVLGTIETGKITHSIAITPDGKELWVNAGGEDHIPIVSTADLKVIGRVPLGEPIAPGHIWFSPNGRTAWVTSPKFGQVLVVDVAGRRVSEKIPVGKGPTFIQVTGDGQEVWGTNTGESSIYVIDADTRRATKLEIGKTPQHLTFIGDKVYVTLGGQDQVAVLDRAARSVVSRIQVGLKPHGIWPSADGKRLYVAREDGDTLAVVDVAAGRVIRTVPVGKRPIAVVVAR